jgi:hypothetical protein
LLQLSLESHSSELIAWPDENLKDAIANGIFTSFDVPLNIQKTPSAQLLVKKSADHCIMASCVALEEQYEYDLICRQDILEVRFIFSA